MDGVVAGGPVWAIVLAAGRGARFGGPKQLACVGGERLVDRSVRTADAVCDGVVVVLPPGLEWDGSSTARTAVGGEQRADSVRAGLAAVPDAAGIVVITDAAHPLSSPRLFEDLIAAVRAGADGAVPVLPMLEIVQRVRDGRVIETLPKEGTRITQMPQAFRAIPLRDAHRSARAVVDDSTLLIEQGYLVVPVDGEPWNLHVCTPTELAVLDRLAGGCRQWAPCSCPLEGRGAAAAR